jgi:hypothetical protein
MCALVGNSGANDRQASCQIKQIFLVEPCG